MTAPVLERLCRIASDVLNLQNRAITLEDSPQTIEGWDSVQHLNLVLALEEEFNVQFDPEEIEEMTGINRILNVLQRKIAYAA